MKENNAVLDQRPPGGEIECAIKQERERIARNLHDGAAQQVVHALHKLELLQRLLAEEQPQQALAEAQHVYTALEAALHSLRHDIYSLLPEQVEERDFVAGRRSSLADDLKVLLHECQVNDPGIEIDYALHEWHLLPVTYREPVLQIIHECITNVRKHAQATYVSIHLYVLTSTFLIEVSDNGAGFQPPISKRSMSGWHIGLFSMRTRAEEVGGRWEIESHPGRGTTVRAYFPSLVASPT